jgi:hypothetical protein
MAAPIASFLIRIAISISVAASGFFVFLRQQLSLPCAPLTCFGSVGRGGFYLVKQALTHFGLGVVARCIHLTSAAFLGSFHWVK